MMLNQSLADRLAAIALLDDPVRRRLYDYVASGPGPVGRDAAADALGMPRSTAAFHLDRLAEAGLLSVEFRRLTGRSGPGAGRPAKLYSRAERDLEVSFPQRRYDLAADVLAAAIEAADDGTRPVRS